jgi:hypothetical protein
MTSPEIQYREAMHLLERLSEEINRLQARVDSAVQAGLRKLEELKEWLGDLIDAAVQALRALARKIKEVLADLQEELDRLRVGSNAPLLANEFAVKWQELRALATQVSGDVRNPQSRFAPDKWQGKAADGYFLAVTPQVVATDRMATTMDKVATALLDAAKETTAFVTAVATAAAAIIVATVAATAAIMTAIAAGPAIIAYVGAVAAALFAMRKAANDYAAAQLKLAVAMEAEAANVTEFPGGAWPQAARAMTSGAPAR